MQLPKLYYYTHLRGFKTIEGTITFKKWLQGRVNFVFFFTQVDIQYPCHPKLIIAWEVGLRAWWHLESGPRCGIGSLSIFKTPDMRKIIRAQRKRLERFFLSSSFNESSWSMACGTFSIEVYTCVYPHCILELWIQEAENPTGEGK